MANKNTGGAAFPSQPLMKMPHGIELTIDQGGMTLRDYFAAAAMQGIQANWNCDKEGGSVFKPDSVARRAYVMADEMLKAREA